jgi:hypothetical protein
MEKRIEVKISTYINKFKEDIKDKMTELGLLDVENTEDNGSNLLRYIFDYQSVNLNKEDFTRRKRVKNCVPAIDRCMAKRANSEQCTRRRKDDCQYCGTHSKGIPHGEYEVNSNQINTSKVVELTVHDINGIMYYIDSNNNVYNQSHVLSEKVNPDCVGKRVENSDGTISVIFN